jgi:hypothetical protein
MGTREHDHRNEKGDRTMPRPLSQTIQQRIRLAPALLVLTTLVGGCSSTTEFEQVWEAAAVSQPPEDAITGRWTGTWQNEGNGHSGPMRAVITRLDENYYLAHYDARYGGMFTFEHVVPLRVAPTDDGDRVEFSGEADLGRMAGGVYEYTGHATPGQFISDYMSEGNTGTYRLSRPDPAADEGP